MKAIKLPRKLKKALKRHILLIRLKRTKGRSDWQPKDVRITGYRTRPLGLCYHRISYSLGY